MRPREYRFGYALGRAARAFTDFVGVSRVQQSEVTVELVEGPLDGMIVRWPVGGYGVVCFEDRGQTINGITYERKGWYSLHAQDAAGKLRASYVGSGLEKK